MSLLVRFACLLLFSCIITNCDVTAVVTPLKDEYIFDAQKQPVIAKIDTTSISVIDIVDLGDLITRVTALEAEVKKLSQLPDVRGKNISEPCDVAIQMLLSKCSSIDERLSSIQKGLNERDELTDTRYYIMDIVLAIRSENFESAEVELLRKGEMAKIPEVVKKVYANSEENVSVLVKFAKSLSKITATYEVLEALFNEMRKNGHQDPIKLIILAEALQTEVMRQYSDPNNLKVIAAKMIEEIENSIRKSSTELLAHALDSSNYQENRDVQKLAVALQNYSPEISDDVMEELVNVTFENIDVKQIIENIYSHSTTSQAISGIVGVYWKLEKTGSLNDTLLLNVASRLSKLRSRADFKKLDNTKKDAVNTVVESIPLCARNLFFEPAVCLWNKDRNVYLLAANSSLNHDTQRRNIFTQSPEVNSTAPELIPAGASWLVDHIGDTFLFRSSVYKKEYLYAAAYEYNSDLHYVFNWIPGRNTDVQSLWYVELHGDHCYLKSMYSDEYLFASDIKYEKEDKYSYVFTWKPSSLPVNSLWQIRSC